MRDGLGKLLPPEAVPHDPTLQPTNSLAKRAAASLRVALSPDGRFAYTANGLTDDMSVVDTGAMRVTQSVKVGTRPWGVAVVP